MTINVKAFPDIYNSGKIHDRQEDDLLQRLDESLSIPAGSIVSRQNKRSGANYLAYPGLIHYSYLSQTNYGIIGVKLLCLIH